MSLPTRLQKEPLIDAVFEIRFSSNLPASDIIPGYLYGRLEGEKSIVDLPILQIPKSVRDTDPNLKYAPVKQLHWGEFLINISDLSLSIGCKLPYPGWTRFKSVIQKILQDLDAISIINDVSRYSIKYIDLLSITDPRKQVEAINFDVMIAGHKLEKEVFQLRVEILKEACINVVQILGGATATLPTGENRAGVVIDVDSIKNVQEGMSMRNLLDGLDEKLNALHQTNKTIFFDCLRPQTLTELEPVYE